MLHTFFNFKVERVILWALRDCREDQIKSCWQMLSTVTECKCTIYTSCLHHHLPRRHRLDQWTDRTVSITWDNGHECALRREGIFHWSAQMQNNIPSTPSSLSKCRGSWISSCVSGIVRKTQSLENLGESLRVTTYWFDEGPHKEPGFHSLCPFSASFQ